MEGKSDFKIAEWGKVISEWEKCDFRLQIRGKVYQDCGMRDKVILGLQNKEGNVLYGAFDLFGLKAKLSYKCIREAT